MRAVIGRSLIQNILTAERKVIEPAVQDLMQKILDKYKAGVLVLQVQLQSVDPPQEVIAAFRDVTAAQQDRDRMRNEAQAYANSVVPAARGQAAAIRQQAEGYRLQTVDEATGQASRFSQVEAQYKIAPALTRERIYLETMEQVLAGSDKVIVDSGQRAGRRCPICRCRSWRRAHLPMERRNEGRDRLFSSLFVAIAAIVVVAASIFTVGQTEQALVLRFGDPVAGRGLVTEPGLHFKIPFIENVVLLDKRILDVETPTQEVLASDNTRVEVDSFLKYRIVDPLKFYQTVGDIDRADDQLGYILNSAVRRVLGDADLTQIVSGDREALMAQHPRAGESAGRQTRRQRRRCPHPAHRSAAADFRKSFQPDAERMGAPGGALSAPRARRKRRRSGPRRIATPSCCAPTRNAMPTRRAARAMRNARAFLRRPLARIRIFSPSTARCRPMTTGLKASNTRCVLSPKSAFFRYFWPPSGTNTAPPAH